ncbi:MAG: 3-isopropylmalate dehydratase small subunit [Myxococcota bacterium]
MNEATRWRFASTCAPLLRDDVDTDQIIPARFLTTTTKTGLGEKLFADWRYDASGAPRSGFPLNDPAHAGAQVLLAGANFGAGSSREHAPWALVDYGFRAVIARSFADIFAGNALKNGLLVIAVGDVAHETLRRSLEGDPKASVSVDLEAQTLTLPDGTRERFPIDGFMKHMLLEGVDELGYLQGMLPEIAAYEAAQSASPAG